MAIKINGTELKYKILHNGGKLKTAYHNGETLLWRAEKYIFQNGVLESGVTLNNIDLGTTLYRQAYAEWVDDVDTILVEIEGIDLTDYSKMDIELNYNSHADYGETSVSCGIDGYSNKELPKTTNINGTPATVTIDISSYTGKHFVGFRLYARNDSSAESLHAWATIWIKSIRLYN